MLAACLLLHRCQQGAQATWVPTSAACLHAQQHHHLEDPQKIGSELPGQRRACPGLL
jgi:hypothetical protein